MPDRKPLMSGNWKMHHNHFEAIAAVQKLSYNLTAADYGAVDVSIHPPFTDLRAVQTLLIGDKLDWSLGAQNCHWEDKGAFTGEVSPVFLAKLDVATRSAAAARAADPGAGLHRRSPGRSRGPGGARALGGGPCDAKCRTL